MKEITTEQLAELLKGDHRNYIIIDVRERSEVAAGKIHEAIHVPLGDIPKRLSEFDKVKEYIFVCRSGARSFQATMFLTQLGYKATNMVGGMLDWQGEVEVAV